MNDVTVSSEDYRLTTAEVLYCTPEYPNLLQSFLWQRLDRIPDFPKLNEFTNSWEKELNGKLDSVKLGYVGIIQPSEWDHISGEGGIPH